MKLAELKANLINEFFSSQGEGCQEEQLFEQLKPVLALVEVELDECKVGINEHDTSSSAYRQLSKSLCSIGMIIEDACVLYACGRRGKLAACINFTSPTKTSRFCTLTEIRNAFKEAEAREQGAIFKTINI